ncbi:hypothetical protein [Paenibacillus sp. UNC499MF]|uniref:hypothetical protein n=1 Tax=Paenibacillus sp. UNC499MF TaxID=1502751 RepID=UPI00089F9E73|nr:hypothetical protein [Paenibacillus sp. UNC499MF]SEG73302.1 hypothetical protein SAMN02799616_04619 [Paenibacillus sp. UNC499MF]
MSEKKKPAKPGEREITYQVGRRKGRIRTGKGKGSAQKEKNSGPKREHVHSTKSSHKREKGKITAARAHSRTEQVEGMQAAEASEFIELPSNPFPAAASGESTYREEGPPGPVVPPNPKTQTARLAGQNSRLMELLWRSTPLPGRRAAALINWILPVAAAACTVWAVSKLLSFG